MVALSMSPMESLPQSAQVLICGAGPTGLVAGIELRRRGIDCVIIDKLVTPQPWSKALGMHSRTLEIMDALGVRSTLQREGRIVQGVNMYGPGANALFHLDLTQLDAPYPWVLSCPQNRVETVLADRFLDLGGQLFRGVELLEFHQIDQQVTVRLKIGEQEQSFCAQVLLGCDGAHSRVREQLDISFQGVSYPDHFLLADLQIDWTLDHNESHFFLLEQGALIALPLPQGWRLVISGASEEQAQSPQISFFEERLEQALGRAVTLDNVDWLSQFSIQRRLAAHYRRNRVFIAGDACHVQSPLGGQGMNTGIADAFNLGWKLAAYVSGQASGKLLDSYERERRPIARQMVHSVDALSKASFTSNSLVRGVRDRLLKMAGKTDVFGRRLLRRLSQQEVHYRSSTLSDCGEFPRRKLFPSGPVPGDRVPDARLQELDCAGSVCLHELFESGNAVLVVHAGDVSTNHVAIAVFALAERLQESNPGITLALVLPAAMPAELRGIREFNVRVFLDSGEQDAVEDVQEGGEQETAADLAKHASSAQTQASFSSRFGNRGGIWVFRPDGYIGYATEIEDGISVMRYLNKLFGH